MIIYFLTVIAIILISIMISVGIVDIIKIRKRHRYCSNLRALHFIESYKKQVNKKESKVTKEKPSKGTQINYSFLKIISLQELNLENITLPKRPEKALKLNKCNLRGITLPRQPNGNLDLNK